MNISYYHKHTIFFSSNKRVLNIILKKLHHKYEMFECFNTSIRKEEPTKRSKYLKDFYGALLFSIGENRLKRLLRFLPLR